MKKKSRFCLPLLASFIASGCSQDSRFNSASHIDVTHVEHSPVKRQAIGNCWIYAASTWVESLLKSTTGEDVNVSETYWTYWDFYEKLMNGMKLDEDKEEPEVQTGGSWYRAAAIIKKYGWVKEDEFVPGDSAPSDPSMSRSQQCAEDYLLEALKEGGSLYGAGTRKPAKIKAELNKAFSCDGDYVVDAEKAYDGRSTAEATRLKDPKTQQEKSLSEWLDLWEEVNNPAYYELSGPFGKKIPSQETMDKMREVEKRIKRALNDHQPVAISFYVSFNAVDGDGVFNLNTLAEKGELGTSGGHLVVLHDYTVKNAPGVGDIGEGDVSDDLKAKAVDGELDYLVVKNSWGSNRSDRPWLRNGYSRIKWSYLTGNYYDEDDKEFSPLLTGVTFPPGY